jgi:quercetin dioxygenase-like cupin family protein
LRPGSYAILDEKAQKIFGGPAGNAPPGGKDPAVAALASGQAGIVIGFCSGVRSRRSQMLDLQAAEVPRDSAADPHDGTSLRFVNRATGAPVFPTLDYRAMLFHPGETTAWRRQTASTLYQVLDGYGVTEVAGQTFEWEPNDIFVVPAFAWRRHTAVVMAMRSSTRSPTARCSKRSANTARKAASRTIGWSS